MINTPHPRFIDLISTIAYVNQGVSRPGQSGAFVVVPPSIRGEPSRSARLRQIAASSEVWVLRRLDIDPRQIEFVASSVRLWLKELRDLAQARGISVPDLEQLAPYIDGQRSLDRLQLLGRDFTLKLLSVLRTPIVSSLAQDLEMRMVQQYSSLAGRLRTSCANDAPDSMRPFLFEVEVRQDGRFAGRRLEHGAPNHIEQLNIGKSVKSEESSPSAGKFVDVEKLKPGSVDVTDDITKLPSLAEVKELMGAESQAADPAKGTSERARRVLSQDERKERIQKALSMIEDADSPTVLESHLMMGELSALVMSELPPSVTSSYLQDRIDTSEGSASAAPDAKAGETVSKEPSEVETGEVISDERSSNVQAEPVESHAVLDSRVSRYLQPDTMANLVYEVEQVMKAAREHKLDEEEFFELLKTRLESRGFDGLIGYSWKSAPQHVLESLSAIREGYELGVYPIWEQLGADKQIAEEMVLVNPLSNPLFVGMTILNDFKMDEEYLARLIGMMKLDPRQVYSLVDMVSRDVLERVIDRVWQSGGVDDRKSLMYISDSSLEDHMSLSERLHMSLLESLVRRVASPSAYQLARWFPHRYGKDSVLGLIDPSLLGNVVDDDSRNMIEDFSESSDHPVIASERNRQILNQMTDPNYISDAVAARSKVGQTGHRSIVRPATDVRRSVLSSGVDLGWDIRREEENEVNRIRIQELLQSRPELFLVTKGGQLVQVVRMEDRHLVLRKVTLKEYLDRVLRPSPPEQETDLSSFIEPNASEGALADLETEDDSLKRILSHERVISAKARAHEAIFQRYTQHQEDILRHVYDEILELFADKYGGVEVLLNAQQVDPSVKGDLASVLKGIGLEESVSAEVAGAILRNPKEGLDIFAGAVGHRVVDIFLNDTIRRIYSVIRDAQDANQAQSQIRDYLHQVLMQHGGQMEKSLGKLARAMIAVHYPPKDISEEDISESEPDTSISKHDMLTFESRDDVSLGPPDPYSPMVRAITKRTEQLLGLDSGDASTTQLEPSDVESSAPAISSRPMEILRELGIADTKYLSRRQREMFLQAFGWADPGENLLRAVALEAFQTAQSKQYSADEGYAAKDPRYRQLIQAIENLENRNAERSYNEKLVDKLGYNIDLSYIAPANVLYEIVRSQRDSDLAIAILKTYLGTSSLGDVGTTALSDFGLSVIQFTREFIESHPPGTIIRELGIPMPSTTEEVAALLRRYLVRLMVHHALSRTSRQEAEIVRSTQSLQQPITEKELDTGLTLEDRVRDPGATPEEEVLRSLPEEVPDESTVRSSAEGQTLNQERVSEPVSKAPDAQSAKVPTDRDISPAKGPSSPKSLEDLIRERKLTVGNLALLFFGAKSHSKSKITVDASSLNYQDITKISQMLDDIPESVEIAYADISSLLPQYDKVLGRISGRQYYVSTNINGIELRILPQGRVQVGDVVLALEEEPEYRALPRSVHPYPQELHRFPLTEPEWIERSPRGEIQRVGQTPVYVDPLSPSIEEVAKTKEFASLDIETDVETGRVIQAAIAVGRSDQNRQINFSEGKVWLTHYGDKASKEKFEAQRKALSTHKEPIEPKVVVSGDPVRDEREMIESVAADLAHQMESGRMLLVQNVAFDLFHLLQRAREVKASKSTIETLESIIQQIPKGRVLDVAYFGAMSYPEVNLQSLGRAVGALREQEQEAHLALEDAILALKVAGPVVQQAAKQERGSMEDQLLVGIGAGRLYDYRTGVRESVTRTRDRVFRIKSVYHDPEENRPVMLLEELGLSRKGEWVPLRELSLEPILPGANITPGWLMQQEVARSFVVMPEKEAKEVWSNSMQDLTRREIERILSPDLDPQLAKKVGLESSGSYFRRGLPESALVVLRARLIAQGPPSDDSDLGKWAREALGWGPNVPSDVVTKLAEQAVAYLNTPYSRDPRRQEVLRRVWKWWTEKDDEGRSRRELLGSAMGQLYEMMNRRENPISVSGATLLWRLYTERLMKDLQTTQAYVPPYRDKEIAVSALLPSGRFQSILVPTGLSAKAQESLLSYRVRVGMRRQAMLMAPGEGPTPAEEVMMLASLPEDRREKAMNLLQERRRLIGARVLAQQRLPEEERDEQFAAFEKSLQSRLEQVESELQKLGVLNLKELRAALHRYERASSLLNEADRPSTKHIERRISNSEARLKELQARLAELEAMKGSIGSLTREELAWGSSIPGNVREIALRLLMERRRLVGETDIGGLFAIESESARERLGEVEAQLRDLGIPDLDRWKLAMEQVQAEGTSSSGFSNGERVLLAYVPEEHREGVANLIKEWNQVSKSLNRVLKIDDAVQRAKTLEEIEDLADEIRELTGVDIKELKRELKLNFEKELKRAQELKREGKLKREQELKRKLKQEEELEREKIAKLIIGKSAGLLGRLDKVESELRSHGVKDKNLWETSFRRYTGNPEREADAINKWLTSKSKEIGNLVESTQRDVENLKLLRSVSIPDVEPLERERDEAISQLRSAFGDRLDEGIQFLRQFRSEPKAIFESIRRSPQLSELMDKYLVRVVLPADTMLRGASGELQGSELIQQLAKLIGSPARDVRKLEDLLSLGVVAERQNERVAVEHVTGDPREFERVVKEWREQVEYAVREQSIVRLFESYGIGKGARKSAADVEIGLPIHRIVMAFHDVLERASAEGEPVSPESVRERLRSHLGDEIRIGAARIDLRSDDATERLYHLLNHPSRQVRQYMQSVDTRWRAWFAETMGRLTYQPPRWFASEQTRIPSIIPEEPPTVPFDPEYMDEIRNLWTEMHSGPRASSESSQASDVRVGSESESPPSVSPPEGSATDSPSHPGAAAPSSPGQPGAPEVTPPPLTGEANASEVTPPPLTGEAHSAEVSTPPPSAGGGGDGSDIPPIDPIAGGGDGAGADGGSGAGPAGGSGLPGGAMTGLFLLSLIDDAVFLLPLGAHVISRMWRRFHREREENRGSRRRVRVVHGTVHGGERWFRVEADANSPFVFDSRYGSGLDARKPSSVRRRLIERDLEGLL